MTKVYIKGDKLISQLVSQVSANKGQNLIDPEYIYLFSGDAFHDESIFQTREVSDLKNENKQLKSDNITLSRNRRNFEGRIQAYGSVIEQLIDKLKYK